MLSNLSVPSLHLATHNHHHQMEPNTNENKTCWICFESTCSPQTQNEWIEPCKCIGSTRWVHQRCLSAWIDRQPLSQQQQSPQINEGEHESSLFGASSSWIIPTPFADHLSQQQQPCCPQCRFPYFIQYAKPSSMLGALQFGRAIYNRLLVASSLFGMVSSVYFLSFSYGFTVCSAVCGGSQAFMLPSASASIDSGNALSGQLRILFGIPAIPWYLLALAYGKLQFIYPIVPVLMLAGGNRGGGDVGAENYYHSVTANAASQASFTRLFTPQVVITVLPLVSIGYAKIKRFVIPRLMRIFTLSTSNEESSSILLGGEEDVATNPRESVSEAPAVMLSIQTAADSLNDDDNSNSIIDEVVIVRHLKRIINALTWPFVSSAIGRIFFKSLCHCTDYGNFHASLLGSVVWTLTSDAASAFLGYLMWKWRLSRRILNYPKQQ